MSSKVPAIILLCTFKPKVYSQWSLIYFREEQEARRQEYNALIERVFRCEDKTRQGLLNTWTRRQNLVCINRFRKKRYVKVLILKRKNFELQKPQTLILLKIKCINLGTKFCSLFRYWVSKNISKSIQMFVLWSHKVHF